MSRPWDLLNRETMPGYWLLASLGKRVLRPGGIELTKRMLECLAIGQDDSVVEYAPGLGVTASLVLEKNPREYVAIERDAAASAMLSQGFDGNPARRVINADATDPVPLPDGFATVVYGESMLTIHSEEKKDQVMAEVSRLLKPGGRYAMQELSILPEDISPAVAESIRRDVISAVRHPAWPKSTLQWREFMARHGFEIIAENQRPVRLLEPERLLEDEGAQRAFEFAWNILQDDVAIRRVREIRDVFTTHAQNLCGYSLVCIRK
ncbi:MAG: methyltransferase domain-containing protein [Candidatus Sumerlaeia bacterium]|nr:methyltransferase domain-containing protein [Candidatus Sumerlaeia bacterium]